MQLQFIVALLVVLALCGGCAGMDSWKLFLGGNDKQNSSTNFTNPPKSDDKGKGKMYSSGSDDGRQSMHQYPFNNSGFTASTNSGTRGGSQSMHQYPFNNSGFTAPTNPGTRGGSQTMYPNVTNFSGLKASTNPGTRRGSQTTDKKRSNCFNTIDAGSAGSVVLGMSKFKSQTVQLPQKPFPPNFVYTTGGDDDRKPMNLDRTVYNKQTKAAFIDAVYKMTNGY